MVCRLESVSSSYEPWTNLQANFHLVNSAIATTGTRQPVLLHDHVTSSSSLTHDQRSDWTEEQVEAFV